MGRNVLSIEMQVEGSELGSEILNQTILNIANSPPGVAERTGILRNAGFEVVEGQPDEMSRLLAQHTPALVISESAVPGCRIPHLHPSGMEASLLIEVVRSHLRRTLNAEPADPASRGMEEFFFAMSHDLQEPLRAISIFTELLANHLNDHMDTESRKYEHYVRTGVKRLERIIRDLLEFSRYVHGEPALAKLVDLEAVLSGLPEMQANRAAVPSHMDMPLRQSGAADRNVTARVEPEQAIARQEAAEQEKTEREIQDLFVITHEPLPIVLGNEGLLAQVFRHLISNSVKYSRRGQLPTIHIEAQRNGDWWEISVRDNGIGFEAQYAERIFGLFKRLHGPEYPGTGLGLAVCRHIIGLAGGRIWADSKPGEGSVFRFTLPAIPQNSFS